MSTGLISSASLQGFGRVVGFQEKGPEKAGSAQRKAIVLNPNTGNPSDVGKSEVPSLFKRTDANTTQPRLQFLKSVLDEFHIPHLPGATVKELKALAQERLPESVKDAMKLEDYDTFFKHPLSDYRVTTALRAVQKEKARMLNFADKLAGRIDEKLDKIFWDRRDDIERWVFDCRKIEYGAIASLLNAVSVPFKDEFGRQDLTLGQRKVKEYLLGVVKGWITDCAKEICENTGSQDVGKDLDLVAALMKKVRNRSAFRDWLFERGREEDSKVFMVDPDGPDLGLILDGLTRFTWNRNTGEAKEDGLFGDEICNQVIKEMAK